MRQLDKSLWRLGVSAWVFLSAGSAACAAGAGSRYGLTSAELADLEPEARLIIDLVQNQHYLGRPFSSIEGRELLDACLRDLDPEALYFTREDVEFLHRRFDRTLKSVYVFRGNLHPAFEIFDLMVERVTARTAWIDQRVREPFDFESHEPVAPEGQPSFLPAGAALDTRWSRRLREHVVEAILAGAEAAEVGMAVAKRYAAWSRELPRVDALAIRERFLNVLLTLFDPHSGYFSADSARAFDEAMGVASFHPGVGLRREDGIWEVVYVLPGSAAEANGTIEPGDTLVAVAEGDGPWQEVGSMRFRDVAQRLRGAAGSRCRLAWLEGRAGERREGEFLRQRSIVPSQRARGAIWTLAGPADSPRRIGWLYLPAFYGTGARTDHAASLSGDARELLGGMRQAGVDGLVLDLRGNLGGSIPEAVALAGLFLDSGAVTLTRGLDGKVIRENVTPDPDSYAGPLVVFVSEQSASASEMFAAALQFHGRAVVVGGATTIGKGTLQSHVDLPATRPADPTAHPNWGVLRLTAQLFYRPDGTPLQRRGVVPDIVLPAPLIPGVKREAELPLALPEETITDSAVVADGPAGRAAVSGELLSHLRTRHGQRAATHPELVLWREEQEVVAQRDERVWGRSLAERRTGLAALEDTWSRLRREHRVLARAGAAAGVTWIDVEEVAAVRQAHLDHLRHRPARDGGARTGRLRRGVFPALQPDGSVVEVGLGGFPFEDFVGDAAEVAAAIGVTKGATVEPDDVANLLRSLQALRERNDEGMLAAVRRCLPLEGADDASVRDEFDALLAKLCILDDSLARPEAMWDFPLREALRIVCDWVEVESPAPVTGANAERR